MFQDGDKVVQIEDSEWACHNFPPSKYPVLTVKLDGGYLKFEEQNSDYSHTASRFQLVSPVGKDTNPKDAVGTKKWRIFSTVSWTVLAEVGVAMLEGARKYGRHNYRVAGVRASVYVDASIGHIMQWWEGEDLDPDTKLSHITKAIASLFVLRDAMIQDMMVDDRPPKAEMDKLRADLQERVDEIFEKFPDAVEAHTAIPPKSD